MMRNLFLLALLADALASWPFHSKGGASHFRRAHSQVAKTALPRTFDAELIKSFNLDNLTDVVERSGQSITLRVDEFVKKAVIALAPIAVRQDIAEVVGPRTAKAAASLLADIQETVKKMRPTAHKAQRMLHMGMLEASRRFEAERGLVTAKLDNASALVKGEQSTKLVSTGASKTRSRNVASKAVEVARKKLDDAKKLVADLDQTSNNLVNGIFRPIAGDCVKLISTVSDRAAEAGDLPEFWDVAEAAASLKAHIVGKSGYVPEKIAKAIKDAQSSLGSLAGVADNLFGDLGRLESK